MRLLINTSKLRFGGAVQVALSVIHELRAMPEHEYHIILGPGVGAVLKPDDFPDNFSFHQLSFGVMKLHKLPAVQRELGKIEARVHPDCVLTTSGPAFWRPRVPHVVGFNRPLYIYPESPYLRAMSRYKLMKLALLRWLHCRYFRRDAEAFIVQTDDVNERVRKLLRRDAVYTVTNNHSGWFDAPVTASPRLSKPDSGRFRFLTLTSYYPHKNLELIPEIIEELTEGVRQRVEFVLTLTPQEYRRHIGQDIPKQVTLTGPVSPPDCPALYNECDAMFLPTLAECFSACYPEAMKMQKPIITTDLGFARSICKNAALYFPPCDARAAAGQISRLIEDSVLQDNLRREGRHQVQSFDTPAQRARKILDICESLVR